MDFFGEPAISYFDHIYSDNLTAGKRTGDIPIGSFKGRGIFIAPESRISCSEFSIGEFSRIDGPSVIKGTGSCTIGKYCTIGGGVNIITGYNEMNRFNLLNSFQLDNNFRELMPLDGDVRIKNNVWIGDNVLILSGIKIGDGAVVGSGSVVSNDLKPFSMSIGAPARTIRMRFSKSIVKQLMGIKWWHWPEDKISRNKQFFEADLSQNSDIELANLIVP